MKYFTYNLIAAANDWVEQTEEEHKRAQQKFRSVAEDYHMHLESLKSRVSRAVWEFFQYGFGEKGLHDRRLISLCVGDGLNYVSDGSSSFMLNRQRTSARIEFLNYEQNFHYLFELRGVRRIQSDLFIDEDLFAKSLGDVFIYELTEIDKENLQLGFLFASGASFTIQFRRMIFRRRRIKPKYDMGEIYS